MFAPRKCFACLFTNHVFPFVMCLLEQTINKQALNDILQELRRSLDFFRTSGKFSIATMNRGGEKEYFLCCGCEEIYIPPTANLTLKGFMVAGEHHVSSSALLLHCQCDCLFLPGTMTQSMFQRQIVVPARPAGCKEGLISNACVEYHHSTHCSETLGCLIGLSMV